MNEAALANGAIDMLRLQGEAVIEAAERLDPQSFARAVKLIDGSTGKAIVIGTGTSGIIARKIAATLTSTGTAAVFLHPSDALHGALGIVTSDDVAIILSNSGETDEILVILPYLELRNVPIISIVGNVNSTLANRSDAVLDAFAAREACPLNLAPTASTSVALAMGDVLAMTLMQGRSLTPEGFAFNHPSGRLGKRLTLTVDALMRSGDERATIPPDATWLEVVCAISAAGLGAVTVEGEGAELLGLITDGDLRRTIQSTPLDRLGSLQAKEFMTSDPMTVTPGLLAYDALQLMENRSSQISVLPVVESGRCVGILRLHDLVRSGI
jgi:arabinose-5-phosphate isomerase